MALGATCGKFRFRSLFRQLEPQQEMARPYASEMAKLSDTFAWAAAADITPLQRAVRTAGTLSLQAIGSGGSLSAAHALASFHQRFAGRIAAVATPLEVVQDPLDPAVA